MPFLGPCAYLERGYPGIEILEIGTSEWYASSFMMAHDPIHIRWARRPSTARINHHQLFTAVGTLFSMTKPKRRDINHV